MIAGCQCTLQKLEAVEFQTIKKATPYQKVHVWSCKRRSVTEGTCVVVQETFCNRRYMCGRARDVL
jgi:hypothetical protein